jgi:PEP-CTERM motif
MNKHIISLVRAALVVGAMGVMGSPAIALTVDGAVYTMDASMLAPNDVQFTLHINETGYTGGGVYLGSLAFNVGDSDFTSFTLLSTPDGVSNWTYIPGGLDASGCNTQGTPWACIQSNANSGFGYAISPLSNHPDDQYVFEFKGVTLTSGVSLKAQYVDANNNKMGSLISLPVISPVPEPETYAMLLAGLGLIGFTARARKDIIV